MKICCWTNLDLLPAEIWPEELPECPQIGDLIESGHLWSYEGGRRVELEVVQIRWIYQKRADWIPKIELHLPKGRFKSIPRFFEWYAKITGKTVHAFI